MEYLIFVAVPLVVLLVVVLLMIWQVSKLDQTIQSLGDFTNDKMAEHEQYMEDLNTQIVEIKEYNVQMQSFVLNQLIPEIDYVDFKADCTRLDYYRHIAYSFHINENNQKFRPLQTLEHESTLCYLEKSVKERAKQYDTKLNLIRPEGI